MSPLLWTEKQDVGPRARLGAGAAYDVARGCVVLFGGSALTGGSFGDTWEWDGSDWTQVEDTGPDARSGHHLAYDAIASPPQPRSARRRTRQARSGAQRSGGAPSIEWDL